MLPTIETITERFGRPDVEFAFEPGEKIAPGKRTPDNLVGKENQIARSPHFPTSFLQVIGPADDPLSVSANATICGNELFNKQGLQVLVSLAEQVTGKAALWIPDVVAEIKPTKDLTKRKTFVVGGSDVRCSVEFVRINDNAALLTFTARV
jgi:hypothetical protein